MNLLMRHQNQQHILVRNIRIYYLNLVLTVIVLGRFS